jgi:hypothetical protein
MLYMLTAPMLEMLSVFKLIFIILSVLWLHVIELIVIMLNVPWLNDLELTVIMLSVVKLGGFAPLPHLDSGL